MSARRGLIVVASLAAFAQPAAAQLSIVGAGAVPDTLASRFRVDFAIPSAPAFDLLPVDPGAILRPAGVRDLVMSLADFAGPEGLRIPNVIAAEASPALLISGHRLSLADYQARPWLYRLRVSGATQRSEDTGDVTGLALGLRLSLIDRSDLRTHPQFVQEATEIADEVNQIAVAARLRAGRPPAPIILTAEEKARVQELNRQLKERWGNRRWNDDVLDIAAGAMAASADADGGDLRAAQYAAWATFGKGFGGWGQLLLGAKAHATRNADGDAFGSGVRLGSRLYVGRNFYKAFAEGAVELGDSDAAEWLLNAGGEVRVMESFWTTFAAGLEPGLDSDGSRLRARFSLKVGLPGLTGGDT